MKRYLNTTNLLIAIGSILGSLVGLAYLNSRGLK